MKTTYHLSLVIEDALNNKKKLTKLFKDETGNFLSDKEAREVLLEYQNKGYKRIPFCSDEECPHFDHVTGCPGHKEEEQEQEREKEQEDEQTPKDSLIGRKVNFSDGSVGQITGFSHSIAGMNFYCIKLLKRATEGENKGKLIPTGTYRVCSVRHPKKGVTV